MQIPHSLFSLQQQFNAVLTTARQNDDKLKRLQGYEIRLLSITTLPELIDFLLQDSKTTFSLDTVTLSLLDPEYEFRRVLQIAGFSFCNHPNMMFCQKPPGLGTVYCCNDLITPKLGQYQHDLHGNCFPNAADNIKSVAMVPLARYDCLIGSLNFGSCSTNRFKPALGIDFLQHLGALVAICLENTLNHERIRYIGLIDPLTGVNNRRYFDQRLIEEVKRSKRNREPLACLFLDIDFFKKVNDTYGHQTGDEVLASVSKIIHEELRQNDVLARYGGEEFTALLTNTGIEKACDIAERIRSRLATNGVVVNATLIKITLSIGVAVLSSDTNSDDGDNDANKLVANADKALYNAKNSGRNRVIY